MINTISSIEEQREDFLLSLTHDLKNPTIAQINSLKFLLDGHLGEIPNKQKEVLDLLLHSCLYTKSLLSTFVSTYKENDGEIVFNYEKTSLLDITKESIAEIYYLAENKNNKINFYSHRANILIDLDRIQIKRVIMNLLSNAIKYAFNNTDINIFVYRKDNNLHFEFRNESPYISKEDQKHLYNKFVSFAKNYKKIGTGIGLYSAKKIISAHKGEMYVISKENNTNIFGFYIPIS